MPGTYVVRDNTCVTCNVKMDLIPKENGGLQNKCPKCGGHVGRVKQTGIIRAKEERNGSSM